MSLASASRKREFVFAPKFMSKGDALGGVFVIKDFGRIGCAGLAVVDNFGIRFEVDTIGRATGNLSADSGMAAAAGATRTNDY